MDKIKNIIFQLNTQISSIEKQIIYDSIRHTEAQKQMSQQVRILEQFLEMLKPLVSDEK